jgi:hypothetical protein
MLGIGQAIDILGGMVPAAPHWMTRVGLEWAFRMLRDPRRIGRRVFVDDPPFFWWMLKQRLRRRRSSRCRPWHGDPDCPTSSIVDLPFIHILRMVRGLCHRRRGVRRGHD